MKRILLITNIPTHYKIDLFNHLNEQLARRGRAFHVGFVALSTTSRKGWEHTVQDATFDWELLRSRRIGAFDFIRDLDSVLRDVNPSLVIISGNVNFYALQIAYACRRKMIPTLLYSGVAADKIDPVDMSWAASFGGFLRRSYRRLLFTRCSGIIAHGRTHAEYAKQLVAKGTPVTVAYNTLDIRRFFRKDNQTDPEVAGRFLPYSQTCKILYCGRLLQLKRVDLILNAANRIRDLNFSIHLLGSGDHEPEIRRTVRELKLEDKVAFWPHVPPKKVPSFYFSADIFVFLSVGDIWGLVVNEAMAASLPVIGSKYAVACVELVRDEYNGYVVDPFDEELVANRLATMIQDKSKRVQMGKNARDFASEHLLISKSAGNVVQAIEDLLTDSDE